MSPSRDAGAYVVQGSECAGWYNHEHRHGGLGLHTAADIHYGRAEAVQAARARVLTAYTNHPERFVRKPPAPPAIPDDSWINPPEQKEAATQQSHRAAPRSG